jgi:hypothetical protein
MTNQIKLHVGYVGKTRVCKRVEIVNCDEAVGSWPFCTDTEDWYAEDGRFFVTTSQYDIIGPWVDEPAPDYNDGKWHGWNGGECPVHPKTVVRYVGTTGVGRDASPAKIINWPKLNGAFRVVTPYVEPPKPREFWLKLTNTGQGIPSIYDHFAGGAIHVREVLDT